MSSEIPISISNHFESMLKRMGNQLPNHWVKNKTKFLLSYSGGRDSSILLLFLKYLREKYQIEISHVFYLSHGIRSIEAEEKDLKLFLQNFGFPFTFVKKKSQNLRKN